MDTNIKLASNTIPNYHLDSLADWIKTYPRLTKGELTEDFERKLSNYIGCKFSRFVNSGSSANLLIAAANLYYKSLNNKKIAIPAVSWSTTLSPFIQLGYEPFLIDCDKENLGINIDHFYEVATKENLSTLVLVHVLGHDSSIEKIVDICEEKNIRLFEDSCESLGSICGSKKLGSFGLASSFSFYYGHHISTIEGGAVCTSNDDFADLICSMRSHGWSRDLPREKVLSLKNEYKVSNFRDLYSFYFPGFNLRSSDLNAYLGLQQLNLLDDYCKIRFKIFKHYKRRLPQFWFQTSNTEFISSFAYGTFVQNPTEVWEYMRDNGVETRPLICGSMGQQPFWKDFNNGYSDFLYANQVHNFGIYLPNNADLDKSQIDKVCDLFQEVAIPYQIDD
tara:strand:- start:345 stop:1520 length:1176 start_codon:yes stop_codon:yes gene_type:complete